MTVWCANTERRCCDLQVHKEGKRYMVRGQFSMDLTNSMHQVSCPATRPPGRLAARALRPGPTRPSICACSWSPRVAPSCRIAPFAGHPPNKPLPAHAERSGDHSICLATRSFWVYYMKFFGACSHGLLNLIWQVKQTVRQQRPFRLTL